MIAQSEPTASPTVELRQRIVWGVALAVSALAVAAIAGWALTIGLAFVAVLVAREWSLISVEKGPLAASAIGGSAVLPILAAGAFGPVVAILLLATGVVAVFLWRRSAWAGGGVAYAGSLGVALVLLRNDPSFGLEAVAFVFAVVWTTDSAAYFFGRAIGGPKLWPAISPNKTWSGAIGGLIAALAGGIAVIAIANIETSLAMVAIVALALSAAAQLGDLFESAIKRRFGAKDAGTLIPGHGGVMDRVDGLTFASVAALLVGALRGGDIGTGLLVW